MIRIITFLSSLLLLAHIVFAQPDAFKAGTEPDGFRGIKWGTHISALNDMTKVWEDGNRTFYERKGESLEIGGAKLHKIIYVFWKDRLLEVRVAILKDYGPDRDELANFNIIKDICFDKFGEQKKPFFGKEQYSWFGGRTWMYLGYEDPGFLRLIVGSIELLKQKKAEDEIKAKQEEVSRKQKVREARGF